MVDAIDEFVSIARAAGAHDMARMRFDLRAWRTNRLREHGCTLSDAAIDAILGKDFELNAAGLSPGSNARLTDDALPGI